MPSPHSLDTLLEEFVDKIPDHYEVCKNACCHLQVRIFEVGNNFIKKAYTLGVEAGKQETLDWLNPSDTSKNERIGVFKVGAKWYKCAVSNDGGSFCSEVCAEKKKHIYPNRTSLKPKD